MVGNSNEKNVRSEVSCGVRRVRIGGAKAIRPADVEWLRGRVDLAACRLEPGLQQRNICWTAGLLGRGLHYGRRHPRRAAELHGRNRRAKHSVAPLTETI